MISSDTLTEAATARIETPSAAPELDAPPATMLSIVILSWNTAELTLACLAALERHPFGGAHEVLVVDNASEDGSPDRIAEAYPGVRLIRNDENLGYAAGNNVGLRVARGRHLLLLNSDTEVGPGALDRLVAFLEENPGAGAVTCKLTNPDGSLQTSCMRFPTRRTALVFDTPLAKLPFGRRHLDRYFMRDFDHADAREVDQIPGTCTLVPRRVARRVGLMDEELWLFFNDVDFCRRIRDAGYAIWFLPDVTIMHHFGASTAKRMDFAQVWHVNRVAYYRKHFGRGSVFLTKPVAVYVALRQLVRLVVLRAPREGTLRQNVGAVVQALWRVLRS